MGIGPHMGKLNKKRNDRDKVCQGIPKMPRLCFRTVNLNNQFRSGL